MIYEKNSYSGNYDICSFENDWGIPIIFSAHVDDGFQIGDTIVFVVENDIISYKHWKIDRSDYDFELKFSEEEAKKLSVKSYSYSFKRFRDRHYLETLQNGNIVIRGTVIWQN